MKPNRSAGLAALGAAGTYLVGFALLFAVLIPAGYAMETATAPEAVGFLERNAGMMIAWNTAIYIVNAFCVAVLLVALHEMLEPGAPRIMRLASLFGAAWVGLLLAAGMVANSAVMSVAALAREDPEQAATLWQVLRAVENGLGGGNEIAGALWIGMSMGFTPAGRLPIALRALGSIAGAAGMMTVIPVLSEPMGAVFGLATLVWFLGLGLFLLRSRRGSAVPAQ